MDKNVKKLLVLIGCLVALLAICIVVVGMIDGFWPWQNQTEESTNQEGTTLDQSNPGENTAGETTTQTTQDTTAETTQETTEETGGNSGGNTGGNSGSNSGSNSGGNSGTEIEVPIAPIKPEPDIGVEEGDDKPVVSDPDQSDKNENNAEIDFDALLGNK